MKLKFKILSLVFSLGTLTFLFQNCGEGGFQAAEESYKTYAPQETEALETTSSLCPVYQKPLCKKTESLKVMTNESGCSYATCTENLKLVTCPVYNQPLCDKSKGEQLVKFTDSNGCQSAVCKRSSVQSCPTYQRPHCKKGKTYLSHILHNTGCKEAICKDCPVYAKPECGEDEKLKKVTDFGSCTRLTCVKKPCPQNDPKTCKAGFRLEKYEDTNKCMRHKCVKEPSICEKRRYNKPRCKKNETLVPKKDRDQCTYHVCEKKKEVKPVCQIRNYNKPLCRSDEKLTPKKDRDQCTYHICVKKDPAKRCPTYNVLLCDKDHYLTYSSNKKGCLIPKCLKKTRKFYCFNYLAYKDHMPHCKSNEKLISVLQKDGCYAPACASQQKDYLACPIFDKRPRCHIFGYARATTDDNGCASYRCSNYRDRDDD